jgi:hypothetical protein
MALVMGGTVYEYLDRTQAFGHARNGGAQRGDIAQVGRTMDSPMPDPPPVTRTTLPSRSL